MASSIECPSPRSSRLKAGDPLPRHAYPLPQDAVRLLQSLALKLWSDLHLQAKDLVVRPLKGAMTNQVYECCWDPVHSPVTRGNPEGDSNSQLEGETGKPANMHEHKTRRVLVRIYGEGVDLFFNREDEVRTFEAMSKAGHGPRLLGRFPNGRVEEFLHARTLTAADMHNPDIQTRIALKMREFHQLSIPGAHQPYLWLRLRDWLQKARTLCSPEHIVEFHLQEIGNQIEKLKKKISMPETEFGFCHNDLQYGNIMVDEVDNTLTIIDYEYSSYNPVAYDIANFFCEMAADYHTDTPHLLDYSKYPDSEVKYRFISTYLTTYSDEAVDQLQVETLFRETDMYALASHLHWGLWGIISAYVNEIDFDYLEYARQRFEQYQIFKHKLMISL